jgi:hypothetical protein
MLEDLAPVFNVHPEPKPWQIAQKALREVANDLVKLMAQAVTKMWPGVQRRLP